MNKLLLKIAILAVFGVICFSPLFVMASGVTGGWETDDSTNYNYKFVSQYPWDSEKTPVALVARFYQLALGLVGAAAMAVIIFGGIKYTISAGNSSKQKDAMDWITGAVWGIVLLAGAYLILYTINPDLTNLKNPALTPINITKVSVFQNIGAYIGTELMHTSGDQMSDAKARKRLSGYGIVVNKPNCKTIDQTDCTSLDGIPREAINGLIEFKYQCGGSMKITGGTESGHASHCRGCSTVDLSKDGDDKWHKCLVESKILKVSPGKDSKGQTIYIITAGPLTNTKFTNENMNPWPKDDKRYKTWVSHWHVNISYKRNNFL